MTIDECARQEFSNDLLKVRAMLKPILMWDIEEDSHNFRVIEVQRIDRYPNDRQR